MEEMTVFGEDFSKIREERIEKLEDVRDRLREKMKRLTIETPYNFRRKGYWNAFKEIWNEE